MPTTTVIAEDGQPLSVKVSPSPTHRKKRALSRCSAPDCDQFYDTSEKGALHKAQEEGWRYRYITGPDGFMSPRFVCPNHADDR